MRKVAACRRRRRRDRPLSLTRRHTRPETTQTRTTNRSHTINASGVNWNKGVLDPTGAQMVLTLKLISVAMCLQDFHAKKPDEMSDYQRQHHVRAPPSPLEFFSYVFAFGNLLSVRARLLARLFAVVRGCLRARLRSGGVPGDPSPSPPSAPQTTT